MPAFGLQDCVQVLDNLPHLILRLEYVHPEWTIIYTNKALERYGYRQEDFVGKKTWNDLIHPDDRVVALKLSGDYMKNNIDNFKLQYRIITADGASIYITEYSHVNRNADASQGVIDSYLVEDLDTRITGGAGRDAELERNLALNDILLTIQDANSNPEKAVQFILDRVGALLDCSRALLFRDSDDHKTCKVVYEWLNHGITSIKDMDHPVDYATEMPEIYRALRDTGVLLVDAGKIPENCQKEFEAEGLVSSAIFAVYQYGDHYGFVCFDDCILERQWDDDTANFLKVVANLLSNVVMNLQSERYMRDYEERIKQLAFRDYQTGLPNQYPFDSDLGDLVLAASGAGLAAHAVLIVLEDVGAVRTARGLRVMNEVCKVIATEIARLAAGVLGAEGTMYRIAGAAYAVLVQPGCGEQVRRFCEEVVERAGRPFAAPAGEFSCVLKVAAVPFGLRDLDPESVNARLDRAYVRCASRPGSSLEFSDEEKA